MDWGRLATATSFENLFTSTLEFICVTIVKHFLLQLTVVVVHMTMVFTTSSLYEYLHFCVFKNNIKFIHTSPQHYVSALWTSSG